ncbi:MAG: helix-turn-helix domain-containing protein [Ignavibacteriaceae bacterium]|nr:helix-turn-helix domain-containing protein [Ignavibacteriaceae bacterium]
MSKDNGIKKLNRLISIEINSSLTLISGCAEELLPHVHTDHKKNLTQITKSSADIKSITDGFFDLIDSILHQNYDTELLSFNLHIENVIDEIKNSAMQKEIRIVYHPAIFFVRANRLLFGKTLKIVFSSLLILAKQKSEFEISCLRSPDCTVLKIYLNNLDPFFISEDLKSVNEEFLPLKFIQTIAASLNAEFSTQFEPFSTGLSAFLNFNHDIEFNNELKNSSLNIGEADNLENVLSQEDDVAHKIILVVEDGPEVLSFLKASFEGSYEVISAENGREGIQKAFEFIPDIIVSDIMMPEVDGLELCTVLKKDERTSHIPIILLTADAREINKLGGLRVGADDFVSKPFSTGELKMRVKNLISTRESLRKSFATKTLKSDEFNYDDSQESIFLKKLDEVLTQNLSNEDFGLEELSKCLFVSSRQLQRKLKAILETTPSQYIRNYRLKTAKAMLKSSSLPVSEVAYSVGFSNLSYFSKSYKELFGESPSNTE